MAVAGAVSAQSGESGAREVLDRTADAFRRAGGIQASFHVRSPEGYSEGTICLKGEKFDTELLFWDQNKQKVYSDKEVRIEQPDQIIYAVGFESNEQLTKYTFFKTNGIFYIDEDTGTAPADTLQADTVK